MTAIEECDVYILSDGTTKIEVRGVMGSACELRTRELERLLGGNVERVHTHEYHAMPLDAENDLLNCRGGTGGS